MILVETPQYDRQDLRSIIKALIEELRLFDRFYEMPNENASEEELKVLYNELRHKLLEDAFYRMYSYISNFPFDDLFTDEESLLKYLLKHFGKTS